MSDIRIEPHDELIDIYNDNGVVTGQEMRSQAHGKGLLHAVSSVLIFKDHSEKEVLLAQRALHLISNPGKWSVSAGGHVPAGKTANEGLLLEISEELFSREPVPKTMEIEPISVFRGNDLPNNYEIVNLYKAYYPGPFKPDAEEVAAIRWVDWALLPTLLKDRREEFADFFLDAYREYTASLMK